MPDNLRDIAIIATRVRPALQPPSPIGTDIDEESTEAKELAGASEQGLKIKSGSKMESGLEKPNDDESIDSRYES